MAPDSGRWAPCSSCRLPRRSFLAGCASAGAGALAVQALPLRQTLAAERARVLAAEVKADIEKVFGEWDRWGWHRVTSCGDLREPIAGLAKALQMKVVEET